LRVFQRPAARRDVLDAFEYLEEQAGVETAVRFLDATRRTLDGLTRMPHKGHLCTFSRPELQDLRRWPVHDFENWLVFYRSTDDAIDVLRILHGGEISSPCSTR
jgi:toxin ParE1/3/4